MWYYAKGDEEIGPIPASELKALAQDGTVRGSTLVWKEGMADWVEAHTIKGLLPAKPAKSRSSQSRRSRAADYDDYGDDEYDDYDDDGHNPYSKPRGRRRNRGGSRRSSNASGMLTQLKIVGIILVIMAILTIVWQILQAFTAIADANDPARMIVGIIGFCIGLALNVTVILGGLAMVRGDNHKMSMAAIIIGFIPFCGPCLGLSIPFSIWGIILLLNEDVKHAMGA